MSSEPTGLRSLSALQPARPLRVQVKDALMELIITRQLLPGQHLAEADVARQLDVSRIPVREALQALQVEGWIDLIPGKGAFVHTATPDEVDQVFGVRVILEQEAARLAASNVQEADILHLRELCVAGRRCFQQGDETGVVHQNALLHEHVASMAGNWVLAELIASLDRRVRWHFTPIASKRGLTSWDEHDELIDALLRGDSRAAQTIMRAHVEHSRRTFAHRDQSIDNIRR